MTSPTFKLIIFSLVLIILSTQSGCTTTSAPTPGPLITFDHYHTTAEINAYLLAAADTYSDLTTLIEIGRSRAQQPIYALEINNPQTGPALEKPAFYLDGNIHGGEILSGEGALYVCNLLLEKYFTDDALRQLVDTRVFYIVPNVNPDGRSISIDTSENHRWNIRPYDQDQDGAADEDPPEDLDGDGLILQMRLQDPQEQWLISTDDPRVMVRRRRNETGGTSYRVLSEGIDNDNDGQFNEDSLGGVDVNRNFPANWHPGQFASGPYPLSEPESFALVEYITSRPNIAAIHTFHTTGGMILRFPTLGDQDWEFPSADIADYNEIALKGAEITGYDNYANEKKKIVDRMSPGHGVFNDWASKVYGVLAMTTEMWKNPAGRGAQRFEWNDQVLEGKGFIDWHPVEHPQLGEVEVGGWLPWLSNNPPEVLMEEELEKNARWVLSFAVRLPQVEILETQVQKVTEVSDTYEVTAQVANVGWMATATVHASEVLRIAQPVVARVELINAELIDSNERIELGILPGARQEGPRRYPVKWRVKIEDSSKTASVNIIVTSEKAGTKRQQVVLNTP